MSSAIPLFLWLTISLLRSQPVHGFIPSSLKPSTCRGIVSVASAVSSYRCVWNRSSSRNRWRSASGYGCRVIITAFQSSTSNDETDKSSLSLQSIQRLDRIIRLRGKVDTGYGRGGKKLGFPTANLPTSLFQNALQSIPAGVYLGWAWIEQKNKKQDGDSPLISDSKRDRLHKAAVNVGYSPTFEGKENKEKIVEAHLILDQGETMTDFYGEVMRLALIGYLRPERKFDSFPELVQAITTDVATAKRALNDEPFVAFGTDTTFFAQNNDSSTPWIGRDGGDADASWEFEEWEEAMGKL